MNLDGERTQGRGKDKSAIGRACSDRKEETIREENAQRSSIHLAQ
jgi:hypothetical protein